MTVQPVIALLQALTGASLGPTLAPDAALAAPGAVPGQPGSGAAFADIIARLEGGEAAAIAPSGTGSTGADLLAMPEALQTLTVQPWILESTLKAGLNPSASELTAHPPAAFHPDLSAQLLTAQPVVASADGDGATELPVATASPELAALIAKSLAVHPEAAPDTAPTSDESDRPDDLLADAAIPLVTVMAQAATQPQAQLAIAVGLPLSTDPQKQDVATEAEADSTAGLPVAAPEAAAAAQPVAPPKAASLPSDLQSEPLPSALAGLDTASGRRPVEAPALADRREAPAASAETAAPDAPVQGDPARPVAPVVAADVRTPGLEMPHTPGRAMTEAAALAPTAQATSPAEAVTERPSVVVRSEPGTSLAQTVGAHIARLHGQGKTEFTLRMDPPELGRIDVRLEMANDRAVRVVVAADSPQTLELMQRDARGLERALADAGLRTDSGSLSFTGRDANAFAQAQGDGQQGRGRWLQGPADAGEDLTLRPGDAPVRPPARASLRALDVTA